MVMAARFIDAKLTHSILMDTTMKNVIRKCLVGAGFLCGAVLLGGCPDTEQAKNNGSTGSKSPACTHTMTAVCDYISDKCKQLPRQECDDTFLSLYCQAGADLSACEQALASSTTCTGTLPSACQGIANLDSAKTECTNVFNRLCTKLVQCDKSTTESSCKSEAQGTVCAYAIGISSSLSECYAQLEKPTVCMGSSYVMPPSCKGVVKVSDSLSGSTTQTKQALGVTDRSPEESIFPIIGAVESLSNTTFFAVSSQPTP
jgi:hypothetical protein